MPCLVQSRSPSSSDELLHFMIYVVLKFKFCIISYHNIYPVQIEVIPLFSPAVTAFLISPAMSPADVLAFLLFVTKNQGRGKRSLKIQASRFYSRTVAPFD